MNLCLVCSEYPPTLHGGIGSMTQVLARGLTERGHRVRVIGIHNAADSQHAYTCDEGVDVYRLARSVTRLGWLPARYRLFREIKRWANEGTIDMVEAPDYQGWTAGWTALPVPVVVRLHGSSTYFSAELGLRTDTVTYLLERSALRRADYTCSVSRYTAEVTRRLFGLRDELAVIHNFVDCPDAPPDSVRQNSQVVFSGTLTAKKGILELIAAWTEVRRTCSNAELHVFGKDGVGPQGGSMKGFLRSQLPREDQAGVHFHGHVERPDLLEAFRTCRVAVFPSRSEAFAMAPLEAMSHGCPTISTRCCSSPEVIRDGEQGILVSPGDPGAIASAIIRVLQDDELARRLGEEGYRTIQRNFCASRGIQKNENFYAECLRDFARNRN